MSTVARTPAGNIVAMGCRVPAPKKKKGIITHISFLFRNYFQQIKFYVNL